ncbi:ester cyclase [Kineococcus sp. R86509]|uniref:ester cyclase n=1 Tax=Kineococcus sp. R86509 TaxID=3093851 RepID=UPI0036D38E0C
MTTSAPASHSPLLDTRRPATTLVQSWLRLWNGDLTLAAEIVAPDFRLHAAMMDGGDGAAVDSPQALVGWIDSTRAAVPDLAFSIEVGPIVDGPSIAVRWRARGSYAGGVPGAQAPGGTLVDFTGTDVLRTEDGRIAEYWVNSDTLLLLTQLQVRA